ncbi:hypothetical protein FRC03_007150, partial [Tulasnella sp. 419]
EPPYGSIPIEGWPDEDDTLARPGAIAIASRAGRTLIVAEQEGGNVTVLLASGLNSQFQPSIPQDAPEEVIGNHLQERRIVHIAAFIDRGRQFAAIASVSKQPESQRQSIRIDLWSPNASLSDSRVSHDTPAAIQLAVFANLLEEELEDLIPSPPIPSPNHLRFFNIVSRWRSSDRKLKILFSALTLSLLTLTFIVILQYQPGALIPPRAQSTSLHSPIAVQAQPMPQRLQSWAIIIYSAHLLVRDIGSFVLRVIDGIFSVSPAVSSKYDRNSKCDCSRTPQTGNFTPSMEKRGYHMGRYADMAYMEAL